MDYSLLLFLLFLASSSYLLIRRKITGPNNTPNLLPGSLGWPVIGETLELFFSESPESFIRKRLMKHRSEVFKTNILGENVVVFSGAEANKLVTANEQRLVLAWLPPSQKCLFGLPAEHKPKSKSKLNDDSTGKDHPVGLSRLLSVLKPGSKAVENFDSIAKELVRKQEDEVVKAYELVKGFVLTLSCSHLLGTTTGPEISKWRLDDLVNGIQSVHVDFPGTAFRKAKIAAGEIRKGIEAIMRKEKGFEDDNNLVSVLMAGKVMVPGTVAANSVMGIMAASYGSVVTTISFMVKFVGERPDVYHKIYSEQMEILALKGSDALNWNHINKMKYTWAVACETMRIAPPFLGTFREVLTDFEFAGFTIPKGWKIFWAVNMTTKNPVYFRDPEKFDPSRFVENEHLPFSFLPFGGGPRMCTGQEYARLAILTFFHNLVTSYKWDILSPDEKISSGMGMPVPENGLPIRLHPQITPGSITRKYNMVQKSSV